MTVPDSELASTRFVRLVDGRLVDTLPMAAGGNPLVSNEDGTAAWVTFEGTFGSLRDASWISLEEEKELFGDLDG